MKRLRIGFDVDGVLADFIPTYIAYAKECGFENIDPTVWDIGLTKEQQDTVWARIKFTENFWAYEVKPIEKYKVPFEKLQHEHTLVFITNRVPTCGLSVEEQTARWLHVNLRINYPTVLVVSHWYEKAGVYKALKLDAFVDDKFQTVEAMVERGQNAYMYDQPWNKFTLNPVLTFGRRVKSIEEYVKRVEEELGTR